MPPICAWGAGGKGWPSAQAVRLCFGFCGVLDKKNVKVGKNRTIKKFGGTQTSWKIMIFGKNRTRNFRGTEKFQKK